LSHRNIVNEIASKMFITDRLSQDELRKLLTKYYEKLKSPELDPNETYTVTIEVSEFELHALEDLAHTYIEDENKHEMLLHVLRYFWQKLVEAVSHQESSYSEV